MKIAFNIAVGSLITWVLLGSLFLTYYQNIDGTWNPPFTFYIDKNNFKTDKTEYHRGDAISIFTSFCANRNFQTMTTWKLINEFQLTFAAKPLHTIQKGCVKDKWIVIGQVPEYAVFGIHHLEGVSQNVINPLKTIYVNFRSVDFKVI